LRRFSLVNHYFWGDRVPVISVSPVWDNLVPEGRWTECGFYWSSYNRSWAVGIAKGEK
jgi:hypothetical protein